MSAFLSVRVSDRATSGLRQRAKALGDGRALMASCAGEVRRTLQDHFAARDAEGNQQGWPSRHFWRDIRRATKITSISANSATVTVADARLNLKIHGGTVTPKRGRMLAIPATAEAYRAGSPREGGMSLVVEVLGRLASGKMGVALVRPEQQAVKFKKTKSGVKAVAGKLTFAEVMYWLVPSANVPRDPGAVPTQGQIDAAVKRGAQAFMRQVGTGSTAAGRAALSSVGRRT